MDWNPITALVNWLLDQFNRAWQWVLDQIVVPPPPQWMVDAAAMVGQLTGQVGQLSHWIPIPVLIGVMAWSAVLVLAAITIRIIRIIASFATLGGGGA